jgi:hypothetical protein
VIVIERGGSTTGLLYAGLLFLGFAVKGLVTGKSWSPYGRVSDRRVDAKGFREAVVVELLIGVGFVIYYLYKSAWE